MSIQQEQEKHKREWLSRKINALGPTYERASNPEEQPASQPRPTGRTACLPAAPGLVVSEDEAKRAFFAYVEEQELADLLEARRAKEEQAKFDAETARLCKEYECEAWELPVEAPLLLTRGAHIHPPTLPSQDCHIDWLSFTSEETTGILEEFVKILIPTVRIIPLKFGQPGYKFVKEINLSGTAIGRIGYGASHNRNLLTLTGKGTAEIDWATFLKYYQVLETPKISRIDIAHDFFEGEVTHEIIIAAYESGKFKPVKSSKNPSIGIISGTDGEGNNKGRTINIGNKKSGKSIRTYEKGLERFAKLFSEIPEEQKPPADKMTCDDVEQGIGQSLLLNWYRMEVQYGNNDRELNFDMIINRDDYFVGAYPFCEEVLKMKSGKTPPRIPNNLETDIDIMFKHLSDQYGSFITTVLSMGMTPEQIIKKVANGKQSQRIIKSGALDKLVPYDPKEVFNPQKP